MRFQLFLAVTLLTSVFPTLAFPFQYTHATAALEARTNAPLVAREYLGEYTVDLERRTKKSGAASRRKAPAPGTGSQSRQAARAQGNVPPRPPHNSHEAAAAAYRKTKNIPAAHDTFHTTTGGELLRSAESDECAPVF